MPGKSDKAAPKRVAAARKTPAKKKATAPAARTRSVAAPQPAAAARPDFNEYAVWSPNNQGRAGTKVDLWIIHTQEGDGNADSLAHYLQGNVGVSYHYTISEDSGDHGVTVCDVVDTDLASWSVLSANNRASTSSRTASGQR